MYYVRSNGYEQQKIIKPESANVRMYIIGFIGHQQPLFNDARLHCLKMATNLGITSLSLSLVSSRSDSDTFLEDEFHYRVPNLNYEFVFRKPLIYFPVTGRSWVVVHGVGGEKWLNSE